MVSKASASRKKVTKSPSKSTPPPETTPNTTDPTQTTPSPSKTASKTARSASKTPTSAFKTTPKTAPKSKAAKRRAASSSQTAPETAESPPRTALNTAPCGDATDTTPQTTPGAASSEHAPEGTPQAASNTVSPQHASKTTPEAADAAVEAAPDNKRIEVASEPSPGLEAALPESETVSIAQPAVAPYAAAVSCDAVKASKPAPRIVKKIVKKKVIKKVVMKRKKPTAGASEEGKREAEVEEKTGPVAEEENVNAGLDGAMEIENPSSVGTELPSAGGDGSPKEFNSIKIDSKMQEGINGAEKSGEAESEDEKDGEKEGEGKEVVVEEVRSFDQQNRRKTEIFIGALDRDAKEEDIKKVFEKVGEVVEIRLIMNNQTGKNRGYAFLRYATPAEAKRAITELATVEVCGKQSAAAALEGNDTIYLGNIDKKWKKEEVMKLLQEIGIENIHTLTVMIDTNSPDFNRGFAFLELETAKDAQIAFKKLQKKDAFGRDRNVKVSWAEPLYEPDEEEMLKVKSVFVEGIPSSWDESKLKEHFQKFGTIERVSLSRNMQTTRRNDFAIINYVSRESAIACVESFNKAEFVDGDAKLNIKVSLAKPIPKVKKNKGGSKFVQKNHNKEKAKDVSRDSRSNVPMNRGKSGGSSGSIGGAVENESRATRDLIQVLREQAAWRPGYVGTASSFQGYAHTLPGGKRPLVALGDDRIYMEHGGYPRPRLDGSFPVITASYTTSLPYYGQPGIGHVAGPHRGPTSYSSAYQPRQGAASYPYNLYRG